MQPSIAIINDISGFGRCSVTVALPILSVMKIHCGVIPTAILSNHTEYPEYSMLDFTPHIPEYLEKWRKLQVSFDGIYTGFLVSEKQISIITKMFQEFSFKKRIVDPVMGDHGIVYDSYTKEMCEAMKHLVSQSTLTTPNVTEICILTDTPYHKDMTEQDIFKMCQKLAEHGAQKIVVTGLEKGDQLGNAIYEYDNFEVLYGEKVLPLRPGTGDVFASILSGEYLHDVPLRKSVKTAAEFIHTCLTTSAKMNVPINDGVCFEEHLDMLIR